MIDAGGGHRRVLTRQDGDYQHPSWSPDARHLVFSYSANPAQDGYALFVIDADGARWKRLGQPSTGDSLDPSWSPDGSRIAFSHLIPKGKTYSADLAVAKADGSGQRVILRAPPNTVYFAPSWSPDGTRLAFVSLTNRTNLGQIDFVNVDGTHLVRLRQLLGDNRAPAWHLGPAK
jgi:Tol biopolymer transport system component